MAFELGDDARAPRTRRLQRGEALVEKVFVDFHYHPASAKTLRCHFKVKAHNHKMTVATIGIAPMKA